MAGVRCRCGECEIRFGGCTSAVFRLECCCLDCRRAALWTEQRGGTAIGSLAAFCDATYWPANNLDVVRGGDKLEACGLNDAFRSCRVISTCCSTQLLVDNPVCQGKLAVTFPEVLVDATLPPPTFRCNIRDLPKHLQDSLPPPTCRVMGPGDRMSRSPEFTTALASVPAAEGGLNLGQLIAGLGAVRILDVPYALAGEVSSHIRSLLDSPDGYRGMLVKKELWKPSL